MSFAVVQSIEGTRQTSGTTCSATFGSNVSAGSILVAVCSRRSSTGHIATFGQVEDGTNKWRQANECTDLNTYGIDLWICENPTAGAAYTVTGTLLAFPLNLYPLSGMNIWIAEVSGCTGFELVDAIGVNSTTGTSVTATTNYSTTQSGDFLISVASGNGTAATLSGWTVQLADTTQKFWVSTTTAGAAGSQSAAWTAMTSQTTGCALIVALRPTGVSSSATHLLQSCYFEPIPVSTPPQLTQTLQTLPVNPAVGNALIAFVTGAQYQGQWGFYAAGTSKVTDTAGNTWRKVAEGGADNQLGLDWCIFVCQSCLGGTTTLTATYGPGIQTPACCLVEMANLPVPLVADKTAGVVNQTVASVSTTGIMAGDLGLVAFGVTTLQIQLYTPSAGWTMINSDTTGAGCHQMYLNAPAGTLSAQACSTSKPVDATLAALRQSPGVGVH